MVYAFFIDLNIYIEIYSIYKYEGYNYRRYS